MNIYIQKHENSCMAYKIKEKTADFIVTEILEISKKHNGKYAVFLLEKENMTTLLALDKISQVLGIVSKDIGFCGLKDKNAITRQYICVNSSLKNILEGVKIEGLKLHFVTFSNERLYLGQHTANKFDIVVRNLDDEKINLLKKIPNYFGEQRFSKQNIEIGKMLIKKDFENAAMLISSDNKDAKEFLESNPNNYIGAIKKIKEKIITLYIHAYQGYLFNNILSSYIKSKTDNYFVCKEDFGDLVFLKDDENIEEMSFPLIGLDSEETEIVEKILKKENLRPRDFINRQLPFLTVEETLREGFVELKNLSVGDFLDDELNFGNKKVTVSFELPKGSYATIAIRAMFS